MRHCRFVWLGTTRLFDAFTFDFEETPHGWFQAHAYRFDDDTSTFIVETPEEVWRKAGLDTMEKEDGDRLLREAVRRRTSTATRCMSNARTCAARRSGSASRASSASTGCTGPARHDGRRAGRADGRRRAHGALLDRLGHQARARGRDRAGALDRPAPRRPARRARTPTRHVRSVEVLKIQNAARNSTEWFENVDRYASLPPEQFAYSLLTRSQRISHENLRLRDTALRRGATRTGSRQRAGAPRAAGAARPCRRCSRRSRLRGVTLDESHRRLADGAVLVRRRRARRLPPRAPRRARAGRRRPGRSPR